MDPLLRSLFSILLTLYILRKANKKKSLSYSGRIAAFFVGTIVSFSNLCHLTALLVFYFTSTKATRYKQSLKQKLDDDFKEGGQRNVYQVLSNGFLAVFFSFLYIIDCGYGERPIDFVNDYRATRYTLAVLTSLCCSCGDTLSSELGPVLGNTSNNNVFHVIKLKMVPKGTNGGISFWGTLASFLGGFLVGLAYYLTLKICLFIGDLDYSTTPQYPVIWIGAFSGLFGSLVDSLLGGYFQYSGFHRKKKLVTSTPGEEVDYISGRDILSNNQVNFLSCLLVSIFVPYVSLRVYKNF